CANRPATGGSEAICQRSQYNLTSYVDEATALSEPLPTMVMPSSLMPRPSGKCPSPLLPPATLNKSDTVFRRRFAPIVGRVMSRSAWAGHPTDALDKIMPAKH